LKLGSIILQTGNVISMKISRRLNLFEQTVRVSSSIVTQENIAVFKPGKRQKAELDISVAIICFS
jgi:hypothetical protein